MTLPIPKFIPEEYRPLLAGRRVDCRLPAVVRRRLRTPEPIGVAEHAERYRIVTEEPHPGPWRNEITPHAVKIMDTFSLPWVREIWLCGPDQAGKTNTMLCCLHWAADIDPGNIFYLMPTEATSDKVMNDKIIPMFLESLALKQYCAPAGSNDTTLSRINLAHGVTIRPAHANSAASMATFSAKHCFCDELDKYPEQVGKETDPINLIRKRNRQYRGRYKRFFSSTPAQGKIYAGMERCRQVWELRQRCPHCGRVFRPDASCLAIPPDIPAGDIGPETGVTYCCSECGAAITELERWRLLGEPEWVCVKGEDVERPHSVGFHLRAWDCRDVPIHEIAAAWLSAQQGGLVERIAWHNGYEAENYEIEHKTRQEDAILALRDDRPEGLVPGGGVVQCLVCGSDTQDNGHYYWVDAVGWGLEGERWRIAAGFVETDQALLQVVFGADFRDAAGNQYPVRLMLKDAMGHRTAQVYDMCRLMPLRVAGYKGAGRRSAPHTLSRPDRYPGTNIPIPGGVPLYICDTNFYKDAVAAKLQVKPGDPGAWHMDAGLTLEQAAHICAEYRDERDTWQCPSGRPNHYWDAAVMSYIASDILQCKLYQRPADSPAPVGALREAPLPRIAPQAPAPTPPPVATPAPGRPTPAPPPRRNPYTGGRQIFGRSDMPSHGQNRIGET